MTRQRRLLVVFCTAIFAISSLAAMGNAAPYPRWRANMYSPSGSSQRSYSRSYNYGNNYRAQPTAPATQSFSVTPIAITKGDSVNVTVDTPLRRGDNVLATVPQGETHKVLNVSGPWVGIAVNQNGEELRGWVNFRALEEVQ